MLVRGVIRVEIIECANKCRDCEEMLQWYINVMKAIDSIAWHWFNRRSGRARSVQELKFNKFEVAPLRATYRFNIFCN